MFESLKGRTPSIIGWEQMRKSAVLIPLIRSDKDTSILFQVRAHTLNHQPGEICFPGGRMEAEESARETAVRETCEELKIHEENVEIICPLDIFVSPIGLTIMPYLGHLVNYKMTFNPDEVDHLFTVPLNYFLENEPEIYYNEIINRPAEVFPYEKVPGGEHYPWVKGQYPVYFYEYKTYQIWGMTARIMKSFVDLIRLESLEIERNKK